MDGDSWFYDNTCSRRFSPTRVEVSSPQAGKSVYRRGSDMPYRTQGATKDDQGCVFVPIHHTPTFTNVRPGG
jgi:hypothetical protein